MSGSSQGSMSSKRQFHLYSERSVQEALAKVRADGMSIRKASSQYNIPKSTLSDILRGRVPENYRRMGPDTVLTEVEEQRLVEWCITLAKCGFPRRNEDLIQTVHKIITDDGRKTPFKNGRPGKKWLSSFFKRHPEVCQRTSEGISKGRAVVTEQTLRKWFSELKLFLQKTNNEDVLLDPTRIFNGDEAGFSLCPKAGKVIGPKGWKNVYNTQMGNEKENITVLLVFSASGETLPPVIVYPYVRPPRDVINSMPPSWILGRSESGWMNSDVFYEYVANSFNGWVEGNNIKKPVLLFIDGHKSHMTMHLSETCDLNGIILYALPANATHIMQPADVSVFRPVKANWKNTVEEWQSQPENINSVLTKATFAPLLEKTLTAPSLPETIRNGFRTCGLYPFDPDAVDYSKCVQNRIESLNTSHEFPSDYCPDLQAIKTAEKVITSIAPNLEARGMDVGIILQEIAKAKSISHSPAKSNGDISVDSAFVEVDLPVIEQRHSDIPIDIEEVMNGEMIFHFPEYNDAGPAEVSGSSALLTDIISESSLLLESGLKEDNSTTKSQVCETETSIPPQHNSVVEISPSPRAEISNILITSPLPAKTNEPPELIINPVTSLANLDSKQTNGKKRISPAFDTHLFTPKPIAKSTRKQPKEKIPSAISSAAWREHLLKKEETKNTIDEDKKRRKEERERAKLNKLTEKNKDKEGDKNFVAPINKRKMGENELENLNKLGRKIIKKEKTTNSSVAEIIKKRKNVQKETNRLANITNTRPKRNLKKKIEYV